MQKVKRMGEGDPRGWRRMKQGGCWLTIDKLIVLSVKNKERKKQKKRRGREGERRKSNSEDSNQRG